MAEKHAKTKNAKKNKSNNCSNSTAEDSEDPLQAQVFDLGENTESDFDLDVPATSGQEYLRRVRIETQHVPEIVVANIDPNCVQSQTYQCREVSSMKVAPPGLAPTIEWQRLQIANFSQLRQDFMKQKHEILKNGFKKAILPKGKNYAGWCILCHGKRTLDESNFCKGSLPLLNIIISMDQGRVQYVLEYCLLWLESYRFSSFLGTWLFALLTAVDKPLVPELYAILRNIARECSNQRSKITSSEDPNLRELNLLICLVARYFDQSDLADTG